MARTTAANKRAFSEKEIDLCVSLLAEMHYAGRTKEETLLRKIMKRADPALAELLYDEPWTEDDLAAEDKEALERGLAGIAAGKVIPDDVVNKGRAAVREYQRRRDAGELDPLSA